MNSIEIVGISKEDAVEKALKKLGLTKDQVEVQVLAEVKPFLGFIGKPECKVKVTPKKGVKTEESLENFDITADFFKTNIKEEKKYEKQNSEKKEIKIEEKFEKHEEVKMAEPKEEPKKEIKEEKIESIYLEEEVKRIDFSSIYKKEESEEIKEERPIRKAELTPEIKGRIEKFLNNIFQATEIEGTYEISVTEENINVSIKGEEAARLIGRRGESLDSLQLLVGLAANKGEEEYTRVIVDIEDYRQKREESIIRYANKMARMSAKQKRAIKLDVMNPYERRIVHASLQNDRFVKTSSEGKEPYRRVVITPKTKRD
ncbi:MAG: RNA-binding cell elongation regulator Jag/EloR [Filifactoraceae bacterium]